MTITPTPAAELNHGDMIIPPLSATGIPHRFKGVTTFDGITYAYIGSTNYEYDPDTTFAVVTTEGSMT